MPDRGKFVVFEGVDGAGKTTQLDLLWHWLEEKGVNAVRTKEPYNNPPVVREANKYAPGEVSPEAKFLLYCADRIQHVRKVVEPALAGGRWVLTDRYELSTLAYRLEAALALGEEGWVAKWRTFRRLFPVPEPDLTIWLDATWEQAKDAIEDPGEDLADAREFWDRVRKSYETSYTLGGDRVLLVRDPHARSPQETSALIRRAVEERFGP